jgi:hypothetical protein
MDQNTQQLLKKTTNHEACSQNAYFDLTSWYLRSPALDEK